MLRYSNYISIRKTNALQKIWQNGIQNGIKRGIQRGIQKVNMQSGKRISQSASGRELRHLRQVKYTLNNVFTNYIIKLHNELSNA